MGGSKLILISVQLHPVHCHLPILIQQLLLGTEALDNVDGCNYAARSRELKPSLSELVNTSFL